MDGTAPAHLVARLRTIATHVLELAQTRDPEGTLALGVEAVRQKVQTALSTRSEALAQEAIKELRALARCLAEPKQDAPTAPQEAMPGATLPSPRETAAPSD